LSRFQTGLDYELRKQGIILPGDVLNQARRRVANGGVYSWLPATPEENKVATRNETPGESGWLLTSLESTGAAILIVILGTLTAMLISGFVPPEGWEPRHCAQASILATWFISFGFTCLIKHLSSSHPTNEVGVRVRFWLTFTKDLLATIATMGGIVVTQFGVFHRCDSYTRWGRTGLNLPAMPEVAAKLEHHIRVTYPAITFTSICIHMFIITGVIAYKYRHALQVFLQRDDDTASSRWFGSGKWLRGPDPGRSPTINREHGMPPDIALQPLLPDGRQVQEPDHRDESTDSSNTTPAQETERPVTAGPSEMTSARHDATDDGTHFVERERPTG
jgi:hypothetical protein